jgi:glucose uptake protein GlcU
MGRRHLGVGAMLEVGEEEGRMWLMTLLLAVWRRGCSFYVVYNKIISISLHSIFFVSNRVSLVVCECVIKLDYTNRILNKNISRNIILGLKLNRLECDGILENNYRNAHGS